MRLSLPLVAACAIGGVAACTRGDWVNELDVPGLCSRDPIARARNHHPPLERRAVVPDADDRVALRVRVVVAGSGQAVHGAQVIVRSQPAVGDITDTLGIVRLDTGLAPGRYVLETRRIGYAARQDSIRLPWPRDTSLLVPLRMTNTDGPCSGFAAVQVRRPWWRWW